MAKNTEFVCTECGHVEAKWAGKCVSCGAWSTLEERPKMAASSLGTPGSASKTLTMSAGKGARAAKQATGNIAKPVSEIAATADTTIRISSTINEFDRVLGGGLVPGGVVLFAGEPGIGKSTCTLLVAAKIAATGKKVLYITGEENAEQVARRAIRIGAADGKTGSELGKSLYLVSEGNLQNALAQVEIVEPDFLVVDSIQTLLSGDSEGRIGSVTQVNEVATDFTNLAKQRNIPTILIGHVTKEGTIAGPRVVEHLVDVVLMFERNEDTPLRMLRAIKNRYGSTDEIGCFEHTSNGLEPVDDPSGFFTDTHAPGVTGFATSITLEGRRALPIEIQGLVTPTKLPNPRKVTQGVEHGRSLQIQAVLDKYTGARLFDQDVFLAVTGGLRLRDSGTDLAIAAALLSSKANLALDPGDVFIGEVSLTGEVRSARDREKRVKESARMFSRIYTTRPKTGKDDVEGVELIYVSTIKQLAEELAMRYKNKD